MTAYMAGMSLLLSVFVCCEDTFAELHKDSTLLCVLYVPSQMLLQTEHITFARADFSRSHWKHEPRQISRKKKKLFLTISNSAHGILLSEKSPVVFLGKALVLLFLLWKSPIYHSQMTSENSFEDSPDKAIVLTVQADYTLGEKKNV